MLFKNKSKTENYCCRLVYTSLPASYISIYMCSKRKYIFIDYLMMMLFLLIHPLVSINRKINIYNIILCDFFSHLTSVRLYQWTKSKSLVTKIVRISLIWKQWRGTYKICTKYVSACVLCNRMKLNWNKKIG